MRLFLVPVLKMTGAAFPLLYAVMFCAGTALHYRMVEKCTIVTYSRTLTSTRSIVISKLSKLLVMIDNVLSALQKKCHKYRSIPCVTKQSLVINT